jgi:hypothetical protein
MFPERKWKFKGGNMKIKQFYFLCLLVLIITGCASQLKVKQLMVKPAIVAPGEDATIMIVFKGPADKIASVTATVRRNTKFFYLLNNDGIEGDETANDKIWSFAFTVPLEAPSDTYYLDISAKDKEGNEIIVRSSEALETGLIGTVEVVVK